MNAVQMTDLDSQINEQKNKLINDRLDMSFGELISMYEAGEIEIRPAFQRHFRWNDYQKTRFIESLLLGIPIPPIFVAEVPKENDERIWEVVDGLQRLSTVLSFFGVLKGNEKMVKKNKWKLGQGDRLPALKDLQWDTLPQKLRFTIKRYVCRVEIIRWNSDYDMRFELFNRLNTGGTHLTPQEIRNAIYRDISPVFNDFLEKLSKNTNFQTLIGLNEKQKNELFDQELILRFLSLYKNNGKINQSIAQYMSKFMRESIENQNFNYNLHENIFNKVVEILLPLKKDIFRQKDGSFATALYDTIMIGVAEHINLYENKDIKIIEDKIWNEVRQHKILLKFSRKGGNNQFQRVKNRLKIAKEIFGNI
ncbi:MAG: DUF262 domain-containing protein [Bacteroidetes bacterium]|nr:MAG: DUF262 domain-containing protein [Bacteroidota bacterium]